MQTTSWKLLGFLSVLGGIPILIVMLYALNKWLHPYGDYGGWHQMAEDVILFPGIRVDSIVGAVLGAFGFHGSFSYGIGGCDWRDQTVIVLFSWLTWMSPLFLYWCLWMLLQKRR